MPCEFPGLAGCGDRLIAWDALDLNVPQVGIFFCFLVELTNVAIAANDFTHRQLIVLSTPCDDLVYAALFVNISYHNYELIVRSKDALGTSPTPLENQTVVHRIFVIDADSVEYRIPFGLIIDEHGRGQQRRGENARLSWADDNGRWSTAWRDGRWRGRSRHEKGLGRLRDGRRWSQCSHRRRKNIRDGWGNSTGDERLRLRHEGRNDHTNKGHEENDHRHDRNQQYPALRLLDRSLLIHGEERGARQTPRIVQHLDPKQDTERAEQVNPNAECLNECDECDQ